MAPGGAASGSPSRRATRASDPLAALPRDVRAAATARGATLAEAHACAGCHDPERAEPGVVAVPLADLRSRYDIDALAAFLASPTPPMPVIPFDAQERRDLAIHLLDAHP